MNAAACCTLGVLMLLARPAAAEAPVPPPVREIAVTERVGERVPLDLVFRATDGRRVRLGDAFDGETPVVLALAYTRCTMLCSLVLRGLADAVRQSRRELGPDFRVVTVSIDPAETTASAARQRAELLELAGRPGATADWAFLVGDEPAIRRLADSVGFSYAWDERTEQFAHPAVIFVLAGDGEVEAYLHGIQYAGALDEALAGRVAGAGQEGGLLSCFRFDPALRKYAGLIDGFLKTGAALLLVAVGGLVGWLWVRERRRR